MMLICGLLFLGFIEGRQQNKLPAFVRQCKNDADVSECARRALDELRPHLVKGIPEFRLPPIDPLKVPSITIERRNMKISRYHGKLTNIVWTGIGNFEVLDAYVNTEKLIYRLTLKIPLLTMNVDVYVNGTLFGFEIDGAGTAEVNFVNVIFSIVLNGERFISKKQGFIRWKTEDVEITHEDAYYSELFGFFNDPSITHLFKLALNRGIRLIGSQIRTVLSSISNFTLEAINQVHAMYPSNVLYL